MGMPCVERNAALPQGENGRTHSEDGEKRERERERTRTNYSYLHRLLFLCYEDNNYQRTEEQQRSEAPFLSPPFPLPYSMCTLTSTEIYVSLHRYELGGRRTR